MTKTFPKVFLALLMVCALLGGGSSLAHAETVSETSTTTNGETLQIAVSIRPVQYVSSASAVYSWCVGTNFGGNIISSSKLLDNMVYGRWYDSTTAGTSVLELNVGQRVQNFTVNLTNGNNSFTSSDSTFYARISWSEYHLNTGYVGANDQYCHVKGFKLELADTNDSSATWYDCGVTTQFNPLINVTYFSVGTVSRTLTNTGKAYYDPQVIANNDCIVNYGDKTSDSYGSVWIKGISARWGHSTSTFINRSSGGGVTNGAITDDYLISGTDTDLSTDGTIFNKVGIATHLYTIKDTHSLSTDAEYAGDNTQAQVVRDIIVKGTANVAMTYTNASGTEQTYDNKTWMAPSGTNADSDRKHAIDVTAYSTNAGTYTVQLKQENTSGVMVSAQEQSVTGVSEATSRATTTAKTTLSYSDETTTSGKAFSAILLANYGDNFKGFELSAETAKLTLFIDNTAPTVGTSAAKTNFAQSGYTKIEGITVTDALSGADGAYYTLAKHADDGSVVAPSTPTDSDWDSVSSYTTPTAAGTYSVYVYGKDNATNRTNAELLGTFSVKEVKFAIVGGTWDGTDATTKTVSIVQDSNGDFVLANPSIPDISTATASSGYDQTTGAWDVTPAAGSLTFATGELTKTYTYQYQLAAVPTPTNPSSPTKQTKVLPSTSDAASALASTALALAFVGVGLVAANCTTRRRKERSF